LTPFSPSFNFVVMSSWPWMLLCFSLVSLLRLVGCQKVVCGSLMLPFPSWCYVHGALDEPSGLT
jgi:hypothetical protein